MQSVDELITQARLLPRAERLRLVEAVEASLASEPPAAAEIPAGPYACSLVLAGTMHTDFHDVSSDKYAHLAEAYSWFTEGFDTKDLQEAKVLLEQLGTTST